MSNTFDDENLEEIDKEKVYQGRFDEKLVKKLGYDDFDDYRNYESFFCDVDEIEELEYRLKNESLDSLKKEEERKCGGSYSLVSRKGGRFTETIWWKNVPVGSWYYYVTSGKDNMVFNNEWSVNIRKKDLLIDNDSGLWRRVGCNYKTKDGFSHYGRNKWKNRMDVSDVWVRKGTKVFTKEEFRDRIFRFKNRGRSVDDILLDVLNRWKKYEDKNFSWKFFYNEFLSKTEIFNGPGQYYEVTNMVEEGMRLIRNVDWNNWKKYWKSKEVEKQIQYMEDDMDMLNGKLELDKLDEKIEREVQSRMSHYIRRFKSQENMKKIDEEKNVKEEKVKYFMKYIKGKLTEEEVDEYLETEDYIEMSKKYEEKVLIPERIEEIGKLLTRIQKDGLDVLELGSLKGMRKSLKDKGRISQKQLYWLVSRLEYDVKIKELMLEGKLSKNKLMKRFECLVK